VKCRYAQRFENGYTDSTVVLNDNSQLKSDPAAVDRGFSYRYEHGCQVCTVCLLAFLYNGIEIEEGMNGRIYKTNEVMDVATIFAPYILKIVYFRRWIDCDISAFDTTSLQLDSLVLEGRDLKLRMRNIMKGSKKAHRFEIQDIAKVGDNCTMQGVPEKVD